MNAAPGARRPHLLYIAFWYPPSRASGVHRALATSRGFVDAGWDVTVITCATEYLTETVGSIDLSLMEQVPSEARVVRVPRIADLDIRGLTRASANFPLLWAKTRAKTTPLRRSFAEARGAAAEAHSFADGYLAWIDPVVNTGLKVDSLKRVDHVLATGNPFSAFEAARILARLIDRGFSVDYRDPWTIDVFTGRTDLADRGTRETERRIVAEADSCFQVNDAIADAYRNLFPEYAEKQHVVYNGYDADSIPPMGPRSSRGVRFGILGTLNERWPLNPIFEAWASVRDDLPDGSELLLGGHLGYFVRSSEHLMASLPGDSSGFRYLGAIPKTEVSSFYRDLDVVILPVPGGPMVTSGKVFEAYALGKPVLCVQTSGGGARTILSDHPLAICVEPSPGDVRGGLIATARMAEQLDIEDSRLVRESARRFERHAALQPMIDVIEDLVVAGTPSG